MEPFLTKPFSGWCDVETSAPPPPPPPQGHPFGGYLGQAGFHVAPTDLTAAFQNDGNASDSSEAESSPLQDYLSNFVMHIQARVGDGSPPLTTAEMKELTLRASRDDVAFCRVDADTLTTLAEWLAQHVSHAANQKSILDEATLVFNQFNAAPSEGTDALERWVKFEAKKRVESLRLGIDAGSILLRIATTPGVDVRIVHEEILFSIVALFRFHLKQHVIPSWNQTGPRTTAAAATETAVSPKKRRRSTPQPAISANSTVNSKWKRLQKSILSTLQPLFTFMERLQALLQSTHVSLNEARLLNLTEAAVQALEMDCQVANSYNSPTNTTALGIDAKYGPQLQEACIDLLTAVFQKNYDIRRTILEDFMGVLVKLPTGKRSLRAFELRYSSAMTPQALSRRNADWVGSYLVKSGNLAGNQPHRIQMMTLLILRLLQSVVERPVYESVDGEFDEEDAKPRQKTLRSGLQKCRTFATHIATKLLTYCNQKEASGAASEFRPILNNLVDDLLSCFLIPEYPAAETMLLALLDKIHYDMEDSKQSRARNLETTYLNLAFDVVGKIHSVQAQLLVKHRELPMNMKLAASREAEISYDCYCGTSREDNLVIRCDNCQTHSHGSCVGINRELIQNEWICDSCRLGRIAIRERLKYGSNQDIPVIINDVYAMRQSFLATLSHRTGVVGLEPSIAFHMAHWADELDTKYGKEAKAATRVVVHGILASWDNGFVDTNVGETMTEEGGIRVILALLARTSPLLTSFWDQLAYLVSLLSDNVPASIRKLSVKAIEQTVSGDPSLMSEQKITNAVSRRLTDESISVREAAVSLVGSYVVRFPEVTKAYHASLLRCISDVGVSVRKKGVNIFLDILKANPFYEARAGVFHVLLQRAADRKEEDSLRNLIYSVLSELWMQDGGVVMEGIERTPVMTLASTDLTSSPSNTGVDGAGPASPGIITPTPASRPYPSELRVLRRADVAARQMTEVVRAGGTSTDLETVLKKMLSPEDSLSGPRVSDRKKELKVVDKNQCDHLVGSLFEILLSTEEQDKRDPAGIGKDLVAVLQTIGVFSDAAPASVHRHLHTVLPYLKGGNAESKDDDAFIVAAACDILFRISSEFDQQDVEQLSSTSTAKDLKTITYCFPPSALPPAVQAYCSLAHRPGGDAFSKELLGMVRAFYKCLMKQKGKSDFSQVSIKIRNNVQRALTVLGLVCQNQAHSSPESGLADDHDDTKEKEQLLVDCDELKWTNLVRECYNMFKLYFGKNDLPTKCASLKALGSVFMANPHLMIDLEQEGFIKGVLAADANTNIKIEALSSWRNILIAEERRIDDGYAKKEMEKNKGITVSKRIQGDQDSGGSIFGGIMTSYADSIFLQTRMRDNRVRLSATRLLEVIMRQGLVNPNEAVPHLFALQGDLENDEIRSLACEMLTAESERRPETLKLRITSGVKKAFEFQTKIGGGTHVSALLPAANGHQKSRECIFGSVFLQCVAKNKKLRQGFFKNLLNLFRLEELLSEESPKKKAKKGDLDVAQLGFAAEILAYLPYTTTTDPLFVIHHIISLVSIQGDEVIRKLAEVLSKVGLASEDKFDDRNASVDALELAAQSKFPSKTPEAASLSKDAMDMPTFARLCEAAAAVTLLLRLQRFLRQMYNLSEERCRTYDPNEKERVGEKGVSKSDVKTPFDPSGVKTDDMDSLIRQYAEFRKLMREEHITQLPNDVDSDLEDDTDLLEPSMDEMEAMGSRKRKNSGSS